jgi:HSP20 family protein
MAVVRFDPFKGFENIAKKMTSIIDEFETGVRVEYGSFSPRVDIIEDSERIIIQAEMAGVKKEDVKVTLNDENVLMIKGEKKRDEFPEEEGNGTCYLRVERNYGSFSRSFMLPENIKEDTISAKFEKGILEVTLMKAEPVKPKEVKVEIS